MQVGRVEGETIDDIFSANNLFLSLRKCCWWVGSHMSRSSFF